MGDREKDDIRQKELLARPVCIQKSDWTRVLAAEDLA